MKEERSTIPLDRGETVSSVFTIPDDYAADYGTGVILAHGAANSLAHPLLASVAQGLAQAGYLVLRFNFLYREKDRKTVDRQEGLRFFGRSPSVQTKNCGGRRQVPWW